MPNFSDPVQRKGFQIWDWARLLLITNKKSHIGFQMT